MPHSVLLAIDLGSSLFKIVYTSHIGRPDPLALTPQLVSAVSHNKITARMAEYGDDPLHSAWVEVDGETYAAGAFAADLSGRQYHELSKWENLLPRILIILGLIAQRLQLNQPFQAQVALLLPRDEVNPPDRANRLAAIVQAATAFRFRGQPFECQLEIKPATEGAGLFAAHAVALELQGINPVRVDIPVVMAGERNTSLLLYRAGRLNPSLSSSDGPGFHQFADPIRKSLGFTVHLPDLIRAIAVKSYRIRSIGNEVLDLTPYVPAVLDDYTKAVQAHLKAKLPPTDVHVIAGGGAFSLIWERLEPWFRDLGIPAVYIGDGMMTELTQMLAFRRSEFDIAANPALPARFADALGIYKALADRQRQAAQSAVTTR